MSAMRVLEWSWWILRPELPDEAGEERGEDLPTQKKRTIRMWQQDQIPPLGNIKSLQHQKDVSSSLNWYEPFSVMDRLALMENNSLHSKKDCHLILKIDTLELWALQKENFNS